MKVDEELHTKDLFKYKEWLDIDFLNWCIKCTEHLIRKHRCDKISIQHKILVDGSFENFIVKIKTRNEDTSKIPYSRQRKPITENAGIGMGLLMTLLLRPFSFFRVLNEGEGYDYYYIPDGCDEEELLEVTGTEIQGEGRNRLNSKIKHFREKHPKTSGYISVSCFPDGLQIHWGYKNET